VRPLINLTDLASQPSVFDAQTDDFTTYFANEFQGTDAQQANLDTNTPATAAALDPIGSILDSIDALLSAGDTVFELLSGDLDTVNLDPIINDFMAADSALDQGISNVTFDLTEAGISFLMDINTISEYLFSQALGPILNWIGALAGQISYLISYVQQTDPLITTPGP
jgi:hypothetical protein